MRQTTSQPVSLQPPAAARGHRGWPWLQGAVLALCAALYALHFVHLSADFPHDSPWNDWSKYTDEGWYGDGAIRHFVLGHWFLAGDFNPAVAMPVWPFLEALVFCFTGVSLEAARALAVAVFGVMLCALYGLLRREMGGTRPGMAAPLALLFACASPFLFAFDRLGILEPLLAALMTLTLWSASFAGREPRGITGSRRIWAGVSTGVLLALLLLTKPTAVALLPAIAFYLWQRAGCRWREASRVALPPVLLAGLLCGVYALAVVRLGLGKDYRYLFDANAYTGFQLEPMAVVLRNTIGFGRFMGPLLYGLFFALMVFMGLLRPRFFRNALVPTLLLWAGGYLLLLGYHNNLQPRYYLLVAVPVTALVALALDEVLGWALQARQGVVRIFAPLAVAGCVLAVAVPDTRQEIGFTRSPDYSYLSAARQVAAIIRAHPSHSPWILSVSGSDLTLMTGLPSLDDDFGTTDLEERVRLYRPGWYVAWNEIDDDKMDALRPLYDPVRVAAIPAMDDPDRNLLILYRLDPATGVVTGQHRGHRTPRPLRTRSGQQPATAQLRH